MVESKSECGEKPSGRKANAILGTSRQWSNKPAVPDWAIVVAWFHRHSVCGHILRWEQVRHLRFLYLVVSLLLRGLSVVVQAMLKLQLMDINPRAALYSEILQGGSLAIKSTT
jgi:hypothetical protein